MNKDSITRTLILNANPYEVWKALTDPSKTKKYMFNCEVRSNWKKGGDITWKGNFQGYESGERGTILDIYEHKYLKYSSIDPNFGIEDKAENYLHISYDIESLGGKTILITTIENFNGDPKRLEHVASGWDNIILPEFEKLFDE